MGLKALARLVAVFLTPLALASTAQAFPRLQIHPVELVGYAGSALRLHVELPCGGSFYGLVTRAAKKGTLEVAAAVAQNNIVCTSMPEPTEVVVDYLATTGFKVIAPMVIDPAQTRLLVARIQDLRIVKAGKATRSKLSATYEPRCGRMVGTLVRQTGARNLEVAIVERPDGMTLAACSARPRTRTITALNLKPRMKVRALRDKPASLNRAFELSLVEVRTGTVHMVKNGGISLTYRRACNQAPVGIVLGTPGRVEGRVVVTVGVLVARYFNHSCPVGAPAENWEKLQESGLSLPVAADIAIIAPANDGLTLHTPTKMSRKGVNLRISHAETCGRETFAVYGRDGRGALAVGVLTHQALQASAVASSCKKVPSEVSLAQPFVAPSVMAGELAVMRLKGSSSR